MSVGVGAERRSRIRGCGDEVHAVSNWESGVRVAPVGSRRPRCLRRHRLTVEHYRPDVFRLGYNRQLVVEIISYLHSHVYTHHDYIINVIIVLAY